MRNEFIVFSILSVILTAAVAYFLWPPFWFAFIVIGPILLMGWYDLLQTRHTLMRNFPILGRGRYVMEELRPKIYQYFIESDTDGKPVSRIFRSVIYQRAKKELDTTPFGTLVDVYEEGYEWMHHSIACKDVHDIEQDPRVLVGGPACRQPYSASLLNVSAMSFGSLSKNAVLALNGGASIGKFAHNTGEGGISPYHREHGGDLIYQLGTGYFGSRAADGNFSAQKFQETLAASPSVKMIEIKLSQGAKPGHGGILPAVKNTPEIASIRGIEPKTDVLSPPFHRAFSTPVGLLEMVNQLRELSDGRPVGFKLCIGRRSEFLAICKAMIDTGIRPDFIAVDGGEGGTGAAPLEFSNSVGMPFRDGLAFAADALRGFDLKKDITLFCSGKVITGFHIFRALALGADACYSARAMMIALGCIQALECNTNHCPSGVATQRKELYQGLNVADKKARVAQYHAETVHAFVELMAAAGLDDPGQISRDHIFRRINMVETKQYSEIFPEMSIGGLLAESDVPEPFLKAWQIASADHF